LTGEVVAKYGGGDGVGECEGRNFVEHGDGVALGSGKASEAGWGVAA
jgi:hypothetical protein